MLVIEKDVPQPIGGKLMRQALMSMEKGDSFAIDLPTMSKRTTLSRIMREQMVLTGKTFFLKTTDGVTRVWRTA